VNEPCPGRCPRSSASVRGNEGSAVAQSGVAHVTGGGGSVGVAVGRRSASEKAEGASGSRTEQVKPVRQRGGATARAGERARENAGVFKPVPT